MISINLAESEVSKFLDMIVDQNARAKVCVACINSPLNSPLNCTLSGHEAAIDAVKAQAVKDGIFAQKLKTGVAYHSPSMQVIAGEYLLLMGGLESQDGRATAGIPMVSSVSAKVVSRDILSSTQYWVDNMVSPVQFSQAIQILTQNSSTLKASFGSITDLVEIGPHPALRRPVKDTAGDVHSDAVTAAVAKERKEKDKKLLYRIEWKPQLSLLQPEQLVQVCKASKFARDESAIARNKSKLCSALELVVAGTLKRIDRTKVPETLRRHVEWMEHQVGKLSATQQREEEIISDAEIESRLLEVDQVLPAWKLYTTCARKLPEILSGELDPLQVVFESDLADIFYADLFQNLCADGRFGSILDLASHENPALRILEVGAGTGGMTGHVLAALHEREKSTGGLSFAEYAYTDISPAFFEPASRRWPDLQAQGRLSFKTFDLGRPLESQGLEPASYDLVIAASVLHASPYLEATIRNVRKALKPGGRLVLLEVINPDDIATNFMAGLVPGWWVAREAWRPHSAAVPEHIWDKCLADNGFSGNDVVIRHYKNDQCHIMSVIVTTAVQEPARSRSERSRLVLVVDRQQSEQQLLLANLGSRSTSIVPFSAGQLQVALAGLTRNGTVICLAEANNRPILGTLSEEAFGCLQLLIKNAPNLLWATSTDTDNKQYPDYGIVQGFLRSIRAEQPDSHIVTVAIERVVDEATCAEYVAKTFWVAFDTPSSKEVEYVVRDGLFMTGRVVEDVAGNTMLRSLLSPQMKQRAWSEGPALQLTMGSPGALDSLRFV
ncbi:hypothetical protein QQZ08_005684 [Neonectria magnoliae]|uniref:Malonyl-CoA:ACP transacylase (MAT) domain-containing protein n=1 Tax=Neonectria magnoliae TaxID=2732573 RepID=A0ABR1I316_9HYPO